MSRITLR